MRYLKSWEKAVSMQASTELRRKAMRSMLHVKKQEGNQFAARGLRPQGQHKQTMEGVRTQHFNDKTPPGQRRRGYSPAGQTVRMNQCFIYAQQKHTGAHTDLRVYHKQTLIGETVNTVLFLQKFSRKYRSFHPIYNALVFQIKHLYTGCHYAT